MSWKAGCERRELTGTWHRRRGDFFALLHVRTCSNLCLDMGGRLLSRGAAFMSWGSGTLAGRYPIILSALLLPPPRIPHQQKKRTAVKWRNDPRQYSHGLYQGGDEPLGRRARWMQAWGERAGPERPPEVRCRPPRWEGLVQRSHGESTRSGVQPTGKSPPASTPCTMGQRTNPEGFSPLEGLPRPTGVGE